MEKIQSRQFQLTYQRLAKPVTVTARWRRLGTWYPDGTEPEDPDGRPPVPAETVAYDRGFLDGMKRCREDHPPVVLTVERDGSISQVAGGTLEGEVSTAATHPVVSKPAVAVRAGVQEFNSRPFTPVPRTKKEK